MPVARGTRLGDYPGAQLELIPAQVAAVERLRPWAAARGHTLSELALAWLLAFPELSSVLVGARRPEQVDQNLRALDWTLTAEERDEVGRIGYAGPAPTMPRLSATN